MIDWEDVTPILVTRGDVDLLPIIETLPFSHVVIWNNGDGSRDDLKVYGRYAAIDETPSPYIFVCDDDVVLAHDSYDALLAAHEPGQVTCNMPQRFRDTGFYDDHALVGFGAIFDRGLPRKAFELLLHRGPWLFKTDGLADGGIQKIASNNPAFSRTCDIVFTALTPRILVDLPYTDLPWATDDTRMYRQPDHVGERTRMLELVRRVRDA